MDPVLRIGGSGLPRVLRLPYRGFAAWAIWGVLPIDGNIADRERLAVLMDLFSRKIVGWAFSDNLESSLVEQAFQMAVQNAATLHGLLHHSDRGSQYAADAYQQLLIDQHVQVSKVVSL